MIEDLDGLEAAGDIHTDICIVGAGAAGITLALALTESGLDCCVLESGGSAFDPRIQSLGSLERDATDSRFDCHLRYFGGSTNHWGGWCAPLNTLDFETRAWVPDSGWPIARPELDAYYRAAQAVCGLGPSGYGLDELSDPDRDLRAFDTDRITPRFYQFSTPPTRFGATYAPALRDARRVRVLLHANVTHLEVNSDASSVTAARVRTPRGNATRVVGRHFVLACGAIQNARILLLSNQVRQHGLGNSQGLVGRYFMQHPHVPCASLLTADPDAVAHLFERFEQDHTTLRASIGPSPEQQRREQILNCSATIERSPDPVSGYGALRQLWRDAKRGRWPDALGSKLRTVIGDLDSMTTAGRWMTLYMRSEQSPNPQSHVTLGNTKDRLGLRRARVEWQLTETDKRTVRVAARIVGEELARLKVGRVRLPGWLTAIDDRWPDDLWGGCHHMGTTRMSATAATGVVDRHCRVHGTGNLFIAGSSVFATGGYANPTLTIVALALRLADHLKTLG